MGCFLVTGVGGFIGAALAARLLEDGHEVVGIDNLSTGFANNVPAGVDFYEAACQDDSLYKERLPVRSYDAIFHIAGQSSGEISFDHPVYDLRTNTESTLLLLQYAHKTACRRFIYAGTMSVYGVQPDEPVKEDALCVPESFYGVGKLASEHYLRIYEQYGIRSTSLRLFNVYGPGQNMENLRQGMVSIFMAMMLKDSHITVKGSPARYRDFVYIDDVVNAFMLCLIHPESYGKNINVGTGIRTTVGSLIDTLKEMSVKPVTVKFSGHTAGDIHGIYADVSQAEQYLAFRARVSLEQGLARMITAQISEV